MASKKGTRSMSAQLRALNERGLIDCSDGHVLVFSYGSNSSAQLRARVHNQALSSHKALLLDFERVFALKSGGWLGGVASLAPVQGGCTRGLVVRLSLAEKERLDAYEGGYREEVVQVLVGDDGVETPAIAYIAGHAYPDAHEPFTMALTHEPTEQYLTAIHVMLREHWPDHSCSIRVCSAAEPGAVVDVSQWTHPGVGALSLAAFVVELSARKSQPWKMPATIHDVVAKLQAVGVQSTASLREQLLRDQGRSLNHQMADLGFSRFSNQTLAAMVELLEDSD